MRKITLHQALSELKTLDARIKRASDEKFISWVQGKGIVENLYPIKEFEDKVKADYKSLQDLILDKEKIKKGIMKANSTIEIDVGGAKMKIIDAITKKESIKLEKTIIFTLKQQLADIRTMVNNSNINVNNNLQRIIEVTLGKDNVKAGASDIESISKPFLETNQLNLVDPINLEKSIDKREIEIETFETDIDSVLSVANAINTIEI